MLSQALPQGAHPPLRLLWRDEHMVALYKPAGWLVHRTGLDAGETRFVLQALRDQIGQHVYPVHRLDKGTCGVLVMGLHPQAARALAEAFARHAVAKHYLALVRGWAPEGAEVDHPLRPDDAPPDAPTQPAHTRITRLARLELPEACDARFASTRAALVLAEPTTGRRHQIRRHLKHLAHPIIGDATHGKGPLNRWWAERLGLQRLWLHAWRLRLPHPVDARVITLDSGLRWPLAAPAALGGCRIWSAEPENRPQREQFLPDLQPNSRAIGQKDGVLEKRRSQKWAAAVDSQPAISKSDSLLDRADSPWQDWQRVFALPWQGA